MAYPDYKEITTGIFSSGGPYIENINPGDASISRNYNASFSTPFTANTSLGMIAPWGGTPTPTQAPIQTQTPYSYPANPYSYSPAPASVYGTPASNINAGKSDEQLTLEALGLWDSHYSNPANQTSGKIYDNLSTSYRRSSTPSYSRGYSSTAISALPDYDMPDVPALPTWSEGGLQKRIQEMFMPQVSKLRQTVRDAIAKVGYTTNPTIRKFALQGAMEGYGQGLASAYGSAVQSGTSAYNTQYQNEYRASMQQYRLDLQAAQNSYNAAMREWMLEYGK